MIVILHGQEPTAQEAVGFLRDWCTAGLLDAFAILDMSTARVLTCQNRRWVNSTLAEALGDNSEQSELVGICVPAEAEAATFAEMLDNARRGIADILPATLMVAPPLTLLVALRSLRESIDARFLPGGVDVGVIAAEQRAHPGGSNELPEAMDISRPAVNGDSVEILAPHASIAVHTAHAVAAAASLWTGSGGGRSAIVALRSDYPLSGSFRLLQAWTRVVDIGPLADHVAQRVLTSVGRWPNPAPKTHEAGPLGPDISNYLLDAYFRQHGAILGLTELALPTYQRTQLSIVQALVEFVADLRDSLRSIPVRMAERVSRAAYDWAAAATERITGSKVRPYDDPRRHIDDPVAPLRVPRQPADDAVGSTWYDFCLIPLALADGTELPAYVAPAVLTTATGRRLVITDVFELAPAPLRLAGNSAAPIHDSADTEANTQSWTERVGDRISAAIKQSEFEAVQAGEAAASIPDVETVSQKVATDWRATTLRFLRHQLLASVLLAGAAIAVVVFLPPTATIAALVATPVVWASLLIRAVLRLARRRRRLEDDARQAVLHAAYQRGLANVRRGDADRLHARYEEYQDWHECVQWWLHSPWLPQPRPTERPVFREVELPPACVRGTGAVKNATLERMAVKAAATVFSPGWLTRLQRELLDSAAREYLATWEPATDPSLLPNPFQDTRRGHVSLRHYALQHSVGVRQRQSRGKVLLDQVLESASGWRLGDIVDRVLPADAEDGDDVLEPVVGWSEAPSSLAPLAARLRHNVVRIERTEGDTVITGSGIAVRAGSLVVTNAHVVGREGPASVTVVLSDSQSVPGTVLALSSVTDLALVTVDVDPASLPAVALGVPAQQGDVTVTLGYPFDDGGDSTFSWGLVGAALRNVEAGSGEPYATHQLLLCSYPAGPGASGSGVFDLDGRLVGIHTAGALADDPRASYISLAVPVQQVRSLLDQSDGDSITPPAGDADQFSEVPACSLAEFVGQIAVEAHSPGFLWTPVAGDNASNRTADVVVGAEALDLTQEVLPMKLASRSIVARSVCVLSPRLVLPSGDAQAK